MLNIKKHIWEGFSYGYKEIGSVGNGKVKVSPVDEVTVRTNANCQYTYSDIRKSICRIFSPANTFFDVYGNFFKVFFYFIYNFLPTFVLVNRKGYLSFASMKGMGGGG